MRSFLVVLCLCVSSNVDAAYPYDSICEIVVSSGSQYSGGSATLIAVSKNRALLLTCKHVVLKAGKKVYVHWAATSETSEGRVLRVGKKQDIAICIVPRPKGLRPIPIRLPKVGESIINAGFPGMTGTLEWQTGKILSRSNSEITYNVRPIPGMSGGATFDAFGNQVGIITYYQTFGTGGGSASGVEMIKFIRNFVQYSSRHAKKRVNWCLPRLQLTRRITLAPTENEIRAPKLYSEFVDYVNKTYNAYAEPDPGTEELLIPELDIQIFDTEEPLTPDSSVPDAEEQLILEPAFHRRH